MNNPRWIAAIETIDGYTIAKQIFEASIDPEATKSVAAAQFETLEIVKQAQDIINQIKPYKATYLQNKELAGNTQDTAEAEAAEEMAAEAHAKIQALEARLRPIVELIPGEQERLYNENLQYCAYGEGYQPLTDTEKDRLSAKLAELDDHEKLTIEGKVIPDYRDIKFWEKAAGKWIEEICDEIGKAPGSNCFQEDLLTPEQRAEIAAQQEADRIAALTPADRAKEMENALNNAADEAARLEKRAQIQGKAFDIAAYYQKEKAAIEAKYAAAPEAAAKKSK